MGAGRAQEHGLVRGRGVEGPRPRRHRRRRRPVPGRPGGGDRSGREPISTGEPAATLTWTAPRASRWAREDGEAFDELRRLALAGIVAVSSGVLAGALALTTEYVRTRKQFGRALAEFQAVTVQIADVYIAGRALDVAVWSGAWRLAEGSADEPRGPGRRPPSP